MVDFKTFFTQYPNFKDCSIQWFLDDKKNTSLLKAGHHPVKGVDWNKIKELNDQGCGMFFSVNSMIQGKREQAAMIHINAWVAESDSISKEEQMKLIESAPLKPSMVIESKNSYHIYYFSKDGTKDSWLEIERGLSTYYHGDRSFGKNYAVVLRLPGTMHQKNPDDKFKIQCLYINQTFFTEAEIKKSFPYDMSLEESTEFVSQPLSLQSSDNIREFMASLGNEHMLSRLSGQSIINSEKIDFRKNNARSKQIYCNGKSTPCWIDEKDYIGSAGGVGGPTRIQWCVWYGASKVDILQWFFDNCADIIPERFDRTSKQVALDKQVDEDKRTTIQNETKSAFQHITAKEKVNRGRDELFSTHPDHAMKFGWKEWDNYLGGIYGGMIYLVGADSGVGKTTFTNQIAANLSRTGVRVTRYSLEDRMEDSAKQEIYYMVNRLRFKDGRDKIEWVPFVNGEYIHGTNGYFDEDIIMDMQAAVQIIEKSEIIDLDKTRDVKIDELVDLMTQECDKGTKVFFIDHLHYFKYETDKQREDLQIEAAMKAINEVARQRNVAVFLVAHYNSAGSAGKDGKSSMSSFKGSSAIKQIANIIIQIRRDGDEQDEFTFFDITKLRGPLPQKEISSRFDISKFEYTFEVTDLQKKKEREHMDLKFKVD